MNISDREKQKEAIRIEVERLKQSIRRLIDIFRKGLSDEKDHKTASGGKINRTDSDV